MPSARLFNVDLARVLAISMVTAFHLWRYFGFPELFLGLIPVHNLAAFGYAGVDLFFAVSGFAMMLTWSNRSDSTRGRVAGFYLARAERIIPPYFVAVLAFAGLSAAGVFPFAHDWKDVVAHLTFTHTLFPTTFFSVAGVFWSLAIEVQFYLIFPLLVRLSPRSLMAALGITFAASMIIDYCAPISGPMSFVYRWNVVGFAPLFILGMLLFQARALIKPSRGLAAACIATAVAAMLCLAPVAADLHSRLAVGGLFATGLLLFARGEEPRAGGSAISSIALASYSVYLYNYVFIATAKPVVAGWIGASLYVAEVFATGWIAWLLVERPVEWLRHRRRRLRKLPAAHVPNL